MPDRLYESKILLSNTIAKKILYSIPFFQTSCCICLLGNSLIESVPVTSTAALGTLRVS